MAQATIGALRVVLGLDSANFTKGLNAAQSRLKRIGKQMQSVGRTMALSITAPIALIGVGILRAAGNFEKGMAQVRAVLRPTAVEFEKLRDLAKDLGRTTKFTASQTAAAMEVLAKNGLNATQILEGATQATLDFAAATGGDLAQSADLITDLMINFNLVASDLAGVVDNATGAIISSKLGFEDYVGAVGQAAGVSGEFGVSMKDMNAALAVTTSAFASGTDAGTSFKGFLLRIAPSSKASQKAIKDLGFEFFDAQGKMKGLAGIAQTLQDGLEGLSDKIKLEKLGQIFGQRTIRTASRLAQEGAEGIQAALEKIGKIRAADVAAERLKNFNDQLLLLRSALEGLAIAIADSGLLKWVTDLAKSLTEMVRNLAMTNPELLKWGTIIAGLVAVVGPLLIVTGLLITAIGTLGPLAAALGAAFTFLTGPLGIAIGLAALAAAGFISISGGALSAQEGLDQLKGSIIKTRKAFTDLQNIESQLKSDTDKLRGANAELALAIFDGGTAAINAASVEVKAISNRIKANEALKEQYISILKLQRAVLSQDVITARVAFEAEFLPKDFLNQIENEVNSRELQIELGFITPNRTNFQEDEGGVRRTKEELDLLTESASKAALAGKAADGQLEFLIAQSGIEEAELRVSNLTTTIEDLGSAANDLELPEIKKPVKSSRSDLGSGDGTPFGDILKDLASEADALEARNTVIGFSTAAEAEFMARIKARNKAIEEGIPLVNALGDATAEANAIDLFASDIGDAAARLEQNTTLKDITTNLKEEAIFLKNRIALVGLNTKEATEFVAITEAMNDAVRVGLELSPEELENIKKSAAALGEAAEELRIKFEQDNAFQGIADDITGPFKDALRDGELSFKSFAKTLLDVGRRLLARLMDEVFRPLEDAILEALRGASSGKSGGGIGGAIASAVLGAFGGAAGGTKSGGDATKAGGASPFASFAHGGSFTVGGSPGIDNNLVAFNASRGERVDITPQGKSSGDGVVVQIINNTPVKTREEQATGSGGEQVRRFIIDEVGKATSRGDFDKQQQSRFGAAPVRVKR